MHSSANMSIGVDSLDEKPLDSINSEGKKMVLLRPLRSVSRREMIQRNLRPLLENDSKKRAQALYYHQLKNRSPLVIESLVKEPVHARLGSSNQQRKKVPILGTNTILLPRKRNSRRNHRTAVPKNASSIPTLNSYNRFSKNKMLFKRNRILDNVSNLKVQVLNDPALVCRRFKMVLDPLCQEKIRTIQFLNPRQIFHGIHPITPISTSITMHERFSKLI